MKKLTDKDLCPDCGDNSCRFMKGKKSGLRTNGGCRCCNQVGIYITVFKAREELLEARAFMRDLVLIAKAHQGRFTFDLQHINIEAHLDKWDGGVK